MLLVSVCNLVCTMLIPHSMKESSDWRRTQREELPQSTSCLRAHAHECYLPAKCTTTQSSIKARVLSGHCIANHHTVKHQGTGPKWSLHCNPPVTIFIAGDEESQPGVSAKSRFFSSSCHFPSSCEVSKRLQLLTDMYV